MPPPYWAVLLLMLKPSASVRPSPDATWMPPPFPVAALWLITLVSSMLSTVAEANAMPPPSRAVFPLPAAPPSVTPSSTSVNFGPDA